jgi:AcrR family transcriptional regulator
MAARGEPSPEKAAARRGGGPARAETAERGAQGTSRTRRSHAERTAETRARIMTAVVETITDVGFQKTTAAEIARRAGVTWGAVQHHFGGKDGILLAVLEDSFERFAERLEGIDRNAGSIDDRVGQFIDHAWGHFSSDDYRSSFEILLNFADETGGGDGLWKSEMLRAWNAIWSELFGEVALPARRTLVLQHYTISVLSGLASMRMLEGSTARIRGEELDLLKDTLSRAFSEGSG